MSWFLRQTIKAKLAMVGLLLIAVVLVQSVLTFKAVTKDQDTFEAQAALQADVTLASNAIEALTTMESAYRGYQLTGDESFVQGYREEEARFDGFMATLTTPGPRAERAVQQWQAFAAAAQAWQDQAATPGLALRRSVNDGTADFSEVNAFVTSGVGARLFADARLAHQEALDGANAELARLARDTVEASERVEIVIAASLLLVVLVCMLAVVLLDRSIAQPLELAVEKATTLARGNVDTEPFPEQMKMRGMTFRPLDGKGEIARVARSLNATLDTFTTVDAQAKAIAAGRVGDDVLAQEVPGELGASLQAMTDNLRRFAALARSVSQGDLTAEVSLAGPDDEMGTIAQAMTDNLRAIAEDVRNVVVQVSDGAEALADGAEESADLSASVARAVGDIKDGIGHQAAATDDVALRVADIAGEVAATHEVLVEAVAASAAASRLGEGGRERVDEVTGAMAGIRQAIEAVSVSVAELEAQSRYVVEMVDLVQAVAEQTNLLALNASIEAARAGDAGRGFAVVAAEVKSLSDKAAASTAQIDATVAQMHERVGEAGRLMAEGRAQVERGADAVSGAGGAFMEIADGIEAIAGRIARVDAAARRIDESAVAIRARTDELVAVAAANGSAIEEVAAASEETATTAEQTGATAQQLAASGRQLQVAIDRLRLTREDAPEPAPPARPSIFDGAPTPAAGNGDGSRPGPVPQDVGGAPAAVPGGGPAGRAG